MHRTLARAVDAVHAWADGAAAPRETFMRALLAGLALSIAACTAQAPDADATPPTAPTAPSIAAPATPTPPKPPSVPPPAAAGNGPDRAHLMGEVSPGVDPLFAPVPTGWANRTGLYARKDALDAFGKMRAAAAKDGVSLVIVSAFRSFKDQKRIWEDKWTGKTLVEGGKLPETVADPVKRALKILEFSSMPGTSRHHWGTDFDFNDLNNAYFESGKGKAVYDWLNTHAAEYGFCQPYSKKGEARPAGYNEERWHWSYTPVARPYLVAHAKTLKSADIKGFLGAETAVQVRAEEDYVQGVNAACK